MEQITIRDIARKCGVGVSTVSRALNNHPDINPETREMILKVMSEYNYVPNNRRAESQTFRRKGNPPRFWSREWTICFLTPMISILQEKARKKKYSCIIERVEEKARRGGRRH